MKWTDKSNDAPYRLCCGQQHWFPPCPDGLVQCCLCFDRFKISDLNIAEDGIGVEDVCKPCAKYEETCQTHTR